MKRFAYALLLAVFPMLVWGQEVASNHDHFTGCASNILYEELVKSNPELKARKATLDQNISELVRVGSPYRGIFGGGSRSVYTIPVVVHIIHDNLGNGDIPDSQVHDAIDDLNEAFANQGFYNPSTGVDAGIQFCLAVQDPNGNFTTGITRTQNPLTICPFPGGDAALKGLIGWDRLHYLNIYVIYEIDGSTMGLNVAGYATFPINHGYAQDGIVVEAPFMGSTQNDSKVLVHEAGHYLGLYHTWEAGCPNNDCLMDGDHVCDTPPDASSLPGSCNSPANTCSTDVNLSDPNNPFTTDQPDMVNNYMDYSFFSCMDAFTQGQADRMVAVLTNSGSPIMVADPTWNRQELLNSQGCVNLCPNPITMGMTPLNPTVNISNTVTFTNTSTVMGTNNYTFTWKVDNTVVGAGPSLTYPFNTLGSTPLPSLPIMATRIAKIP